MLSAIRVDTTRATLRGSLKRVGLSGVSEVDHRFGESPKGRGAVVRVREGGGAPTATVVTDASLSGWGAGSFSESGEARAAGKNDVGTP